MITVTLVPERTDAAALGRRHVYLYDVLLDGETIVADSSDPECDLARALVARGIGGHVAIIDGKTGRPRSTVNIEKAAKLCVREDQRRSPHFEKWRPADQDRAIPPLLVNWCFPFDGAAGIWLGVTQRTPVVNVTSTWLASALISIEGEYCCSYVVVICDLDRIPSNRIVTVPASELTVCM